MRFCHLVVIANRVNKFFNPQRKFMSKLYLYSNYLDRISTRSRYGTFLTNIVFSLILMVKVSTNRINFGHLVIIFSLFLRVKASMYFFSCFLLGIPVDIIQLMDDCVEIPQVGIIRSLNVHISGSIMIWEYCKQHMFK